MRLSEGVAVECSYTQLVEMTVVHYDFAMLACNNYMYEYHQLLA